MSLQLLSFLSLSLLLLVVLAPNTRQFSFQNGVATQPPPPPPPPPPCPLNFSTLSNLVRKPAKKPPSNDAVSKNCHHFSQLLRLALSDYLRSTGFFHPPLHSAASCWRSFESVLLLHSHSFKKILPSCNFQTESIAQSSCMNISTRSEFERLVPQFALNEAVSNCNQSLDSITSCGSCLSTLNAIQSSYLTGREHTPAGTIEGCSSLPIIYAAAVIAPHGPADPNTAKCLFSLYGNRRKKLLITLITALLGGLVIFVLGGYLIFSRWKQSRAKHFKKRLVDSIGGNASSSRSIRLVKFDYDEIKRATMNFRLDNLIGRGGFANVYRGILPEDGRSEEVAIKRFKNSTAAGCAEFTNEVEMIASVGHHVNLVQLRGYCVAEASNMVGHNQRQRIIVYDLMKNGSLHDHLFERNSKLSWPIREKIALGMARGLAYLHHGVQPAIIHRDIKASNILLDENFNAKVADFGFAKFYPQGLSHLSTDVAGTMGYLAPEYVNHGHISESSDVYSFGVVLLELLSGKKAVMSSSTNEWTTQSLLTDWARSLVQEGRTMDVVEEGMPEQGSNQVMEKYVHVAILCSHSEMECRPAMDQVVKILESSDDFHLQSPPISEVGEITDS